jgi:hypothetical protein
MWALLHAPMPRRLPGAADPRECQPAGEGSLGLPGNQGFLGGFGQVGIGLNLQPVPPQATLAQDRATRLRRKKT